MRRALLVVAAFLVAGCGSTKVGPGRATVWVTRDRGGHVLHLGKVPAGLSAMQAVARLGKVGTSFGGRYLRSVDGLDEHGRSAWFYYVNGYLADRASTDYRLRPGDVEALSLSGKSSIRASSGQTGRRCRRTRTSSC